MIEIRPAARRDAAAISALIVPVASEQIAFEFDQAGARHLLDSMSAGAIAANMAEAYRYFIAEADGQMLGVIGMRGENHVYQLFVSKAHQRQGIGAVLLHRARDESIAQFGVDALTVYSSRTGEGFYLRQGFRRTGGEQQRNGVVAIPMRLELTAGARPESPGRSGRG